jgi:hypothetical protein
MVGYSWCGWKGSVFAVFIFRRSTSKYDCGANLFSPISDGHRFAAGKNSYEDPKAFKLFGLR